MNNFISQCFTLTATEQKKRNSKLFAHPPRVLATIPKYKAKWKLVPEYRISDNIPTENARNILIATSWRFGSTFLGDLLNHYPGTFYSFEPLHYLDHRVSSIILLSTLGNKRFNTCYTNNQIFSKKFKAHFKKVSKLLD